MKEPNAITLPSVVVPEVHALGRGCYKLYYHNVKFKIDLVRLVRFLITITSMNPSMLNKNSTVFRIHNEFYYLKAKANGHNDRNSYRLELSLHRYIGNNLKQLVSWEKQTDVEHDISYEFDEIWECLECIDIDCCPTIDYQYCPLRPDEMQTLQELNVSGTFLYLLSMLKDQQ